MWEYYDRRVAQREPGAQNVLAYFRNLGVQADLDSINVELDQITLRLRQLPPMRFLDLGAGPSGQFTSELAGDGLALDQSMAALCSLRSVAPDLPLVRADAMHIPFSDKAFGRIFISHLYGLLLPDERAVLIDEASRVGHEIVILDSGHPRGAEAEQWQRRRLADGTEYPIFRRHLDIDTLISEVGGEALYDGQYFIMSRRIRQRP
jgi:SAM-dependent methyltransferase